MIKSTSPFLLFIVLGAANLSFAQTAGAVLTGRVTGTAGAAIPAATVTLTNSRSVIVQVVTTVASGIFKVEKLSPGQYTVAIAASGYQGKVATLTVRAGHLYRLGVALSPPSGPNSAWPATAGGEVMSSATVRDIPLNGRSTTDVAVLEPGVSASRAPSSGGQAQRGFGDLLTIAGSRPRENDFLQDGISVTDYANSPPGSAAGVNLGVDAVQQVGVMQGIIPAQYGQTAGGIVNFRTRSGGQTFHGDAFEFARNSIFDARTFFNLVRPPFSRNQFGGTLGGPIRRGRAYFFGAYEGFRQSLGISQVDTVPTGQARSGRLSTGTVAVDPAVQRFLDAFYPLPNGQVLPGGDIGVYNFAGQQVIPENYFDSRVDLNLSSRDKVYGTYLLDVATVRQPDEFNNKTTGYDSSRQVFSLTEDRTFNAHIVNSVRTGLYRVVASTGLTFPLTNPAMADSSYGTVPGQNAAQVMVTALTPFSGGLQSPSNYHFYWTAIQAYDNLTITRAKHVIRAGFSVQRDRDNILGDATAGGQFVFNTLADFLTNRPYSLAAAIPGSLSVRGLRQTIFGAYAEDRWQATSRFTMNFGLRYEPATVPGEARNRLTVLRHLTDAAPQLGAPLFVNPTRLNLEPRIGLAFDPRGNGHNAIGAGFGVFDVLPLLDQVQFNEINSAPYFQMFNTQDLPAGTFPTTAYTIGNSPNSSREAYFQHRPHRSYVAQWNLTAQRMLSRQLGISVAYIGARGVHLPFRVEGTDIVLPTATPQGYVWPSPIGSGHRINPHAGRITSGFWTADSYYDALQAHLTGNWNGIHLQTSYTWGKTIDDSSADIVGDEYLNSISSPLFFDPRLNRGLADFNIAQNLELNFQWSPTWGVRSTARVRRIVQGWQLGGVFEASTGVPFTPQIGGDALGVKSSDPAIDVPNVVSGPGCKSAVQHGDPFHYIRTQCFAYPYPANLRGNLGRNTLTGPGLVNLDTSLIKNTNVTFGVRKIAIQMRAEFFNVLNHANFSPPLENKYLFDPGGQPLANAGLIVDTETPGREIQFAVKAIW